jgi:CPA1 family monovalent cation:H+ antiporter
LYAALFCAFLIVLRLVWVYPGAYSSFWIRKHILHQTEDAPSASGVFVVGWTGMRGVISLAAAISVPQVLAHGEPFTQRSVIIFLTFAVILVTLVLQGLTLPPVIRGLGLAGPSGIDEEERSARRLMAEAAISHLEEARSRNNLDDEVLEELSRHYRRRLATVDQHEERPEDQESTDSYRQFATLASELLGVERRTAVHLRNERKIGDELLRELEHELDLGELKFGSKRNA